METVYKLTNQNFDTPRGKKLVVGNKERSECGADILAYRSPELALVMNSLHANFPNPIVWVAVTPEIIEDDGTQLGCAELTTIERIEIAPLTTEQRVEFAIRKVLTVCDDPIFVKWADGWLDGSDRLLEAAREAAEAAWMGMWAAVWARVLTPAEVLTVRAQEAALWAAEAAVRAARAEHTALWAEEAEVRAAKATLWVLEAAALNTPAKLAVLLNTHTLPQAATAVEAWARAAAAALAAEAERAAAKTVEAWARADRVKGDNA